MSDRLADFPVTFHNRQYAPLMVGGMGVNISNDTLALAVEKLGGIAHLSDALLMDIADKQFGTGFCKDKIHRYKNLVDTYDKSEIAFDLDRLAESTRDESQNWSRPHSDQLHGKAHDERKRRNAQDAFKCGSGRRY